MAGSRSGSLRPAGLHSRTPQSAAAAGNGAGAGDCLSRVQQNRRQEQPNRPAKHPKIAAAPQRHTSVAHLCARNQDASHPALASAERRQSVNQCQSAFSSSESRDPHEKCFNIS
ncbi:hypothetical protein NDU88_003071 [Pleurodeles waltl]|uniref:Uncharacterized protein n=1 Tax=Pleurodeles waltl TaxID=8319 RepID=A0AAV7Q7Z5_PLEWA|nr:hypothetical protein NDU88_003071 [Pleurodeles waltl]